MANGYEDPPPPPGPPASRTRVSLRFSDHDVELAPGETVVGRSPRCQLVLDDPLVSRSHARLVVNGPYVTIEDLGSANGVLVNGQRLERARVLGAGDTVAIGQSTFSLGIDKNAAAPARERSGAQTLSGFQAMLSAPESAHQEPDRSEATRKGDALDLLVGVADKVLALGRGDEAERILGSYLRNLLQAARIRREVDVRLAEKASMYALRIAEATGKGGWVDYVFELYTVVKRPLPAPLTERLYESLRKTPHVSISVFREYLSALRAIEAQLGPAERFLLRRLEGLESLGAMR